MTAQREMTLDEWCERLPPQHTVNKELDALRAHIEGLEARVRELEGLLRDAPVAMLFTDSESTDGEEIIELSPLTAEGDVAVQKMHRKKVRIVPDAAMRGEPKWTTDS